MPPDTTKERRANDADLADSILRILRSALGKELRNRIRKLVNEERNHQ